MLFDPFTLGTVTLENRLVRSATYEKRADADGFVTDSLIEFYADLVRGGAGLIITGNALVDISGRSVPQMICLHNDFYVDKLRRLVDAVHDLGGRIVIQLTHGGRQCFPALLGGREPLAPSAVPETSKKGPPRAMTHEEIWEVIEAFGAAARRALWSGFDGIQIHGAHGYLVSEFLSAHTNRRDDYWGGDEERRFHFAEEVCKIVRDEAGSAVVMMKLNSRDFIEGGLDTEESIRIARRLEALGLDAIEVSGGIQEAGAKTAQPNILRPEQEAYFRDASRLFKKELRLPVILVGGIRSRDVAEEILAAGHADLVALSRPLIREPDLPRKFREGKDKADCISCNGCMRFFKLDVVRCTQLEQKPQASS